MYSITFRAGQRMNTAPTVAIVGLPLAVEFAKHFPTIGFDSSERRVQGLARREDTPGEIGPAALADAVGRSLGVPPN